MKKVSTICIALLALASCGGKTAKPTLSFPIETPDGLEERLEEFINVCSDVMETGSPEAAATGLGWSFRSRDDGNWTFEKESNSLTIYSLSTPYLLIRNCQLAAIPIEDQQQISIPALNRLGDIEGFAGDSGRLPDGNLWGNWSAVLEGGDRVLLSYIQFDNTFTTLNLSRSTYLNPEN